MGDLPEDPKREVDPDVESGRHAEDLQRLDYEQTVAIVRMFTDVRFKLLALVPTVSAICGSPEIVEVPYAASRVRAAVS
jgi:hypothetical protein